MHIIIVSMIDDPFDPPGQHRFGGGQLFLFDLGRYLVRKGNEVTYIVRKNDRSKPDKDQLGQKCKILRLEVGPTEEITPNKVATLIDKLKVEFRNKMKLVKLPDVIHSVYWISGDVAFDYCKDNKIKHVHSILSLGRLKILGKKRLNKIERLRDQAEVRLYQGVDDLITVCPNELNDLVVLYKEISRNCHIIPYGIDAELFHPRPEHSNNYLHRKTNGF